MPGDPSHRISNIAAYVRCTAILAVLGLVIATWRSPVGLRSRWWAWPARSYSVSFLTGSAALVHDEPATICPNCIRAPSESASKLLCGSESSEGDRCDLISASGLLT